MKIKKISNHHPVIQPSATRNCEQPVDWHWLSCSEYSYWTQTSPIPFRSTEVFQAMCSFRPSWTHVSTTSAISRPGPCDHRLAIDRSSSWISMDIRSFNEPFKADTKITPKPSPFAQQLDSQLPGPTRLQLDSQVFRMKLGFASEMVGFC